MNQINILDIERYNNNLKFTLDIQFEGKFTIVGCSIRIDGEVLDFPLRYLYIPGECIWLISPHHYELSPTKLLLGAEVRFSTWSDEKCTERLSDTNWQPYESMYTKVALGSDPIPHKELNKGWLVPYNEG